MNVERGKPPPETVTMFKPNAKNVLAGVMEIEPLPAIARAQRRWAIRQESDVHLGAIELTFESVSEAHRKHVSLVNVMVVGVRPAPERAACKRGGGTIRGGRMGRPNCQPKSQYGKQNPARKHVCTLLAHFAHNGAHDGPKIAVPIQDDMSI